VTPCCCARRAAQRSRRTAACAGDPPGAVRRSLSAIAAQRRFGVPGQTAVATR
jgi:hypothetical protein